MTLSLQEKVCEELGGYCEKGAAAPVSEGADAFGPNDAGRDNDKDQDQEEEGTVVTTTEEESVEEEESTTETTEL